jgi:putative hemolysin
MIFIELLIVFSLVLLNGALAMSELAIALSRQTRLRAMVQQHVKGARRALALASDPGRFLATVQIGITLIGIIAGAFSGVTIADRLANWFETQGVTPAIAEPLAFGLVITGITYISLIFGEIVPKQIALRAPEQIACRVAPATANLAQVSAPLVWVLNRSAKAVLSLLGQTSPVESAVTDAEIHSLIAEAESAGVIEPEERTMIRGVMRLGDRPVAAVMTPRGEVDMVDVQDPPRKVIRAVRDSAHSRLVAYDGSPDEVIGILQAKDLLRALANRRALDALRLVKKAPMIPENMDALDAVGVLKASEVHIALVHDEYGHFLGVVNSFDILEAIVGTFATEEGPNEPAVVRRDDGSYLVSGSMPLDELGELIDLPLPTGRGYHTVAGWVLDEIGHLPHVGESFGHGDWRFEVVDLDGRRIDKVLVTRQHR